MRPRHSSRNNQQGMTLVELMVVVVIIGILAVIVARGLTRPTNASAARGLAHKVWVATRTARTLATNNGSIVRIVFASGGQAFTVDRYQIVAPYLVGGGNWLSVSRGQATGSAKIKCVTILADAKVNKSTDATCILPRTLYFYPDGRAGNAALTGATVYVQDGDAKYQHKVYVFKLTGFSRHVTNW